MTEPTFRPRLNHVAISMDPSVLDDVGFLLPLMVEIQHLVRDREPSPGR